MPMGALCWHPVDTLGTQQLLLFSVFFPFSKDLSDLFLILYIHLCSVHECVRACKCSKSHRGSFGGAVHASTAEPSH